MPPSRRERLSQPGVPIARSEAHRRRGKHGPRGVAACRAGESGNAACIAPEDKSCEAKAVSGSVLPEPVDRVNLDGSCESTDVATEAASSDGTDPDATMQKRINGETCRKIRESLSIIQPFWEAECTYIEFMLNEMVAYAKAGGFQAPYTWDATQLRSKFFFGNGYTYGKGQRGREALLPPGSVDPIPVWIQMYVIQPLVVRGILKPGWVNSVVVNDYAAGGQIVAHIDPPQLFDRPIVTSSFFDPGSLVFGASFDPARTQKPIYSQYIPRGGVLVMDGFAANEVTHGMRPEDMTGSRRVSLVLRHVKHDAPKLIREHPLTAEERRTLIRRVQGLWRDKDTRYVFDVRELRVLLWRIVGDVSDVADVQLKGTWDIFPSTCYIQMNGTILDDANVTDETLFWRRYHEHRQANNVKDGILWHRLEPNLAACLDKLKRTDGASASGNSS